MHFPPQLAATLHPSHIDAFGVDDRIIPYVKTSGIDSGILDGFAPPFSAHKPIWAQWLVIVPPRIRQEQDVIFRLSSATQPQWEKAKQRLHRDAAEWLPTAHRRAEAAPDAHRASVMDTLANEIASMLHKEYAATIGTVKVPLSSAARWSPDLSQLRQQIKGLRHRRYRQLAQDVRGCRSGEEMPRDLAPSSSHLRSSCAPRSADTLGSIIKLRLRRPPLPVAPRISGVRSDNISRHNRSPLEKSAPTEESRSKALTFQLLSHGRCNRVILQITLILTLISLSMMQYMLRYRHCLPSRQQTLCWR